MSSRTPVLAGRARAALALWLCLLPRGCRWDGAAAAGASRQTALGGKQPRAQPRAGPAWQRVTELFFGGPRGARL